MMWGSSWWIFGALFMVVCMVLMARMMMGHGDHGGAQHGQPDTPERTLDNRLARGEIDIEEYERLRETLRRRDTTAQP
jgi:putative membrane protein